MLPQEIIVTIANNLSTKDRITCTSVCRSWKDPFQRALWKHIEMKTRERLWMICYEASQQGNKYHSNGHCTHDFCISFHESIDNEDFYTLLKVFPSLRSLKIVADLSPTITLKREPGNIFWKALTVLDIVPPRYNDETDIKEFANLLSFTPNVKRLTILQSPQGGVECTWNDLEVIHDCLPLLNHLEIYTNLSDFESKDAADFTQIKPTRVTSLIIHSYDQCIFWVYYFACKYPKVHTIKCSLLGDLAEGEETDSVCAKLKNLSSPFQHLKTLETNTNLTEIYKNDVFYTLLDQNGVKLKDVTCILGWGNDTFIYSRMRDLFDVTLTSILSKIRGSVERLSINCPTILKLDSLLLSISLCTTLVDLQLCVKSETVLLEHIIRCFPSLKRLAIRSHSGLSILNNSKKMAHNSLETLELSMVTISQDVLRTSSQNMTNLKRMVLEDVTIEGHLSKENGEFCIDMSSTRFDYLKLKDVHFHYYYHLRSCFCINFSSVLQSDYQEQRESEKRRFMFSRQYFESRKLEMKNKPNPDRQHNSCQGHLGNDMWRDDLSRGYATLRCKGVETLNIHGCAAHNIFPE
ncbi:hypothetical protein J3Q64DRAFT_1006177 [Phycomyces blakesleeanus]|uniref:F-box domain-containing protein n=2 Tax=Phycomyces blakesleeanus TaxID=4837 RepID=A0A167PGE9_PHYB8|nr:hypothetical protein PHYBLDRAFT_141729 [Phycomyces blakesleeanus NRRL 1555(-)]OAD77864.1 hypothetical protein PHYBLDRAFT_141729 [Phycomyces blakesleeanus NRRL 1555(-)]|eukprot:XP_018295904.1 hypothetical protein PHYBLDRAFT_141729 [Phycomyces blakesleeanus NRRL 1555(-)]